MVHTQDIQHYTASGCHRFESSLDSWKDLEASIVPLLPNESWGNFFPKKKAQGNAFQFWSAQGEQFRTSLAQYLHLFVEIIYLLKTSVSSMKHPWKVDIQGP